MSTPEIRAVVFDLDGLMFNTEEVFNRSGVELLRRKGMDAPPELFLAMMGRRATEAFQCMREIMGLDDPIEDLQRESEEIFDSLLDEILAPMPGLTALLEKLEQHEFPKAVATSSDRAYVHKILGRYALLDRFQRMLTAEDVVQGKPHPEIYLKAAAALNVAPQQMLVLEDSENGTKAAAAAGAHVVSVPHEMSRHHNFSGAYGIASSLNDPLIHNLLFG